MITYPPPAPGGAPAGSWLLSMRPVTIVMWPPRSHSQPGAGVQTPASSTAQCGPTYVM